METNSLFTKCKKVIDSCETEDQLEIAKKFVYRAYSPDEQARQMMLNRICLRRDKLRGSYE